MRRSGNEAFLLTLPVNPESFSSLMSSKVRFWAPVEVICWLLATTSAVSSALSHFLVSSLPLLGFKESTDLNHRSIELLRGVVCHLSIFHKFDHKLFLPTLLTWMSRTFPDWWWMIFQWEVVLLVWVCQRGVVGGLMKMKKWMNEASERERQRKWTGE